MYCIKHKSKAEVTTNICFLQRLWLFRGHQHFQTSEEGKRKVFSVFVFFFYLSCNVDKYLASWCCGKPQRRYPLLKTWGKKKKSPRATFPLTSKTTQNYNTHKYSTTLSSAIIHIILPVEVMMSVNLTHGVLRWSSKTKYKSHDKLTTGGPGTTSQFSSFNYLIK